MVSFRSVNFSDGQDEMTGIDAPWANHGALPAQLARLQEVERLVRMGIVKFLNGFPQAGMPELSGRTDSRTAAARHAFAHIRLYRRQLFELLPVEQVKIDSGTWNQTETEIYHLSRSNVL